MPPKTLVLIPARRGSTRLPEKLLLDGTGTPLIAHTCMQAAKAFGPESVIVCADDPHLIAAVEGAGFTAQMTAAHHQSGTDRIAEVAAQHKAEIIVNVQGDEPEIDPEHIRLVAELLHTRADAGMATLVTPGNIVTQMDPNAVKAVMASNGTVLTFTRAPAPWDREAGGPAATCNRHLGIYAYRRELLLSYADLPPSSLEACEKLEQLRALEAGITMVAARVANAAPGIDTESDYQEFLTRFAQKGLP